MTDLHSLLAACALNPECDTRRLVLADWLQEQGEEARAEFIRVQVELARRGLMSMVNNNHPTHHCLICGALWVNWEESGFANGSVTGWSLCSAKCGQCCDNVEMGNQIDRLNPVQAALVEREHELLAAHPEWRSCPCPECKGWPDHAGCKTCHGTEDLFKRRSNQGDGTRLQFDVPRAITYDRGLPHVECTLEELGSGKFQVNPCQNCGAKGRRGMWSKCGECNGKGYSSGVIFVPSPWARAVAERGMVVGFRVRELEILLWQSGEPYRFFWRESDMPTWVYLNLPENRNQLSGPFRSPNAAHLALARAAGTAVWRGITGSTVGAVESGHGAKGNT